MANQVLDRVEVARCVVGQCCRSMAGFVGENHPDACRFAELGKAITNDIGIKPPTATRFGQSSSRYEKEAPKLGEIRLRGGVKKLTGLFWR